MKVTLPIDVHIDSILQSLKKDVPLILTASAGSGKTTRVPFAVLRQNLSSSKKIIVIVPKRISAVGAALRVSDENNLSLGEEIGYQVRFESKISNQTRLIYMTEGVFLKRCQSPQFLNDVSHIFLDEFHERSSQTDLILGFLYEKSLLTEDKKDLFKLIIMSATLNTDLLIKYLGSCECIDIKAPPFPLTVAYNEKTQRINCDDLFYAQLKETCLKALKTSQKDILIFLPGFREMRRAEQILRPSFPKTLIEMAHGSMGLEAQKRLIQKDSSERRIILSTNIAESSITLPDLDCVIDSGLEKNAYFEPKMGFSKLEIERASIFSAVQRQGRASRTQAGFCFKLWNELDERSMPAQKKPEILTSSLLEESLFLASQNTLARDFSWIERPSERTLRESEKKLKKWNLIQTDGALTPLGKLVMSLPLSIEDAITLCAIATDPNLQPLSLDYFSKKDQVDLEKVLYEELKGNKTDLEKIIESHETHQSKHIKQQLKKLIEPLTQLQTSVITGLDINEAFFKAYSENFPERIVISKGLTGTALSGRGVELAKNSAGKNFDYYAALSGFTKSAALTFIDCTVGIPSAKALAYLSHLEVEKTDVLFDSQKNQFYQMKRKYLKDIPITEGNKQFLTQDQVRQHWTEFLKKDSASFLNLNASFQKISDLYLFALDRNLTSEKIDLNEALVKHIEDYSYSLDDYKDLNLFFYLDSFLTETLSYLLKNLPEYLVLPNGKKAFINYADPKSPMISAKLQDCFGWKKTPTVLDGKLKVTIELLAPNMRPTQITQDLEYFWKNSYQDVRKDLRARYPKHAWPEDPFTST